MTTIRNFCCNDFLRFSSVNLDHFTITENMFTYFTWLAKWPDYFIVALDPGNRIMGYILAGLQDYYREGHLVLPRVQDQPGVEDQGKQWFGQIITVIPPFALRLFVAFSNTPAINFFNKFGFRQCRGIEKFYIGEEAAMDMRKSLVQERLGELYG